MPCGLCGDIIPTEVARCPGVTPHNSVVASCSTATLQQTAEHGEARIVKVEKREHLPDTFRIEQLGVHSVHEHRVAPPGIGIPDVELAGEEPGRKWSQAVRLLDVMRAGASEVEQYERVALRDLPDVNTLGRVVNDLVHLVAELLENATSFSAPETKVSVTANMLNTGGVMLEIEDAGIGMTPEELDDANERLANPPVIDVAISRRMGLYVVGRLATRRLVALSHHVQPQGTGPIGRPVGRCAPVLVADHSFTSLSR